MDLKYIKTMVKEHRKNRGLKYTPTYNYNKKYVCNTNIDLLLSMGGSQLNKQFKIGGIIIQ